QLLAVLEEGPDTPETRRSRASAHNEHAYALRLLSRHRDADAAWQRGIDLLKRLVEQAPANPDYHRELIDCHYNRMRMWQAAGDYDEEEQGHKDLIATHTHRVKRFAGEVDYLRELAQAEQQYGQYLFRRDRNDEARRLFNSAIGHLRDAIDKNPKD